MNRRQFLLGASIGVATAVPLGYALFAPKPQETGLFGQPKDTATPSAQPAVSPVPPQMDLSFLAATQKRDPVVGVEDWTTEFTLEMRLLALFSDNIKSNPDIKKEWFAQGGNGKVSIAFGTVKRQHSFVAETDPKVSASYQQYCAAAMQYAWERCALPGNPPRIDVFQNARYGTENIGVVNSILDLYQVPFTLKGDNARPLSRTMEIASEEGAVSGFLTRIKYDRANRIASVERKSPVMLSTATDTHYNRLAAPFSEALNWAMFPVTQKAIAGTQLEQQLNSSAEIQQYASTFLNAAQAVCHATAHTLLAEFAEKNGIPISPAERRVRIQFQKSGAAYPFERAMQLAEKEGPGLVRRYLENPHQVRSEVLRAPLKEF